jgi:hypothetical protein
VRKLYAVFVPLLAVVAFASITAAASAAPQWEVCKEVAKETGGFTTISCETAKAKSNFEKGQADVQRACGRHGQKQSRYVSVADRAGWCDQMW